MFFIILIKRIHGTILSYTDAAEDILEQLSTIKYVDDNICGPKTLTDSFLIALKFQAVKRPLGSHVNVV